MAPPWPTPPSKGLRHRAVHDIAVGSNDVFAVPACAPALVGGARLLAVREDIKELLAERRALHTSLAVANEACAAAEEARDAAKEERDAALVKLDVLHKKEAAMAWKGHTSVGHGARRVCDAHALRASLHSHGETGGGRRFHPKDLGFLCICVAVGRSSSCRLSPPPPPRAASCAVATFRARRRPQGRAWTRAARCARCGWRPPSRAAHDP